MSDIGEYKGNPCQTCGVLVFMESYGQAGRVLTEWVEDANGNRRLHSRERCLTAQLSQRTVERDNAEAACRVAWEDANETTDDHSAYELPAEAVHGLRSIMEAADARPK